MRPYSNPQDFLNNKFIYQPKRGTNTKVNHNPQRRGKKNCGDSVTAEKPTGEEKKCTNLKPTKWLLVNTDTGGWDGKRRWTWHH